MQVVKLYQLNSGAKLERSFGGGGGWVWGGGGVEFSYNFVLSTNFFLNQLFLVDLKIN